MGYGGFPLKTHTQQYGICHGKGGSNPRAKVFDINFQKKGPAMQKDRFLAAKLFQKSDTMIKNGRLNGRT